MIDGHLAVEGVGYLDMRDYNRARWAWEHSHPASTFMQWLKIAGHVNFTDQDVRVTRSATPAIPIPATKLAWEEITRLAAEVYDVYNDVETAARTVDGAETLMLLARELSTAMHRWPAEEKPHRVNVIPCPGCNMLTLIYRPPREQQDEVIVTCMAECGSTLTGQQFADILDLMEQEHMQTRKLARRWVTVEDAAELTGKSKDTIWRWTRDSENTETPIRTMLYDNKKFYNLADLYDAEGRTRARAI